MAEGLESRRRRREGGEEVERWEDQEQLKEPAPAHVCVGVCG